MQQSATRGWRTEVCCVNLSCVFQNASEYKKVLSCVLCVSCHGVSVLENLYAAPKKTVILANFDWFLPRCMECSRGIAIGILTVRPSVRLTRALWQNGRKLCLDSYIIRKNIYPSFLWRRMVGGGDPFYLKFWVNGPALERNLRFSTDNRS